MATWVIGDVQGCMSSLERLLDRIDLDPARDQLWLVGDLVNRGPRSLDVLRWARDLDARHPGALVAVLGNHDLHLLQRAAGTADEKKRDTLAEVLRAPDRDGLIDWLRARPMLHAEDGKVLVHAGLHPRWTVSGARALAAELEAGLRGDDWTRWIAQLGGGSKAHAWHDDLRGAERVRAILSFLIRVRCLDKDDVPDDEFSDHPRRAPRGRTPWFERPGAAWSDHTVYFGHWAALGLAIGTHHVGLDSGCVWGKQLTAFRTDDQLVVQVKAVERSS